METSTSNWSFTVILWVPLTDWSCNWITLLIMYSRTPTNSHLFTTATFLADSPYIDTHLKLCTINGYSPLSPRWPLWRGSTVIELLWLTVLFREDLSAVFQMKSTAMFFSDSTCLWMSQIIKFVVNFDVQVPSVVHRRVVWAAINL